MATVQLTDIYNPLTFASRTQEAQAEKNAFIRSGVMAPDPLIARQLASGGNIGDTPFFAPLTVGEPNYSSDNPASKSTPKNVTGKLNKWRSASRNESWSIMDLARELALADPVGAITGRIGHFWATDDQTRLIRSCQGILADNIANDGGDMLHKVGTDTAGAVEDAERISAECIIDAEQTLGDMLGEITAIAMHSAQYGRLRKQNLITAKPNADQSGFIETYLGREVLVDDSLPAIAQTNRILFTVVLFGKPAFVTGAGKVETPSEIGRNADAGDGGGETVIHSRVNDVIHPNGFSFLSASVAGPSATYAELADATNWTRTVDRKHVPMAFLQVNE